MKLLLASILCLFCLGSVSHASIVYFQDFSASGANIGGVAVPQGVLQEMDGVTIVGGDAANQATNGDYTYQLTSGNGATTGNGYILNAPGGFVTDGQAATNGGPFEPGSGITNVDEPATFTTGTITLSDGATGTFSVVLNAFNVGGEFLSINSVSVDSDAVTGEVTLDLSINGFGDFASGGNENIGLITNFTGGSGAFNPINNINFPIAGNDGATNFENQADFINQTGITAQNQGFDDLTFSFTIRDAIIPEPSSVTLLVLAGFAAFGLRRRRCVNP